MSLGAATVAVLVKPFFLPKPCAYARAHMREYLQTHTRRKDGKNDDGRKRRREQGSKEMDDTLRMRNSNWH